MYIHIIECNKYVPPFDTYWLIIVHIKQIIHMMITLQDSLFIEIGYRVTNILKDFGFV
jgi:hypothetical protein